MLTIDKKQIMNLFSDRINMTITKRTLKFTLTALLFAFFSLAIVGDTQAQNTFSKQGEEPTTTSKKSTKESHSSSASSTKITRRPGYGVVDRRPAAQKGATSFCYLFRTAKGETVADFGSGTVLLKDDSEEPFVSVIQALNYLVGEQKWRLVHTYEVSSANPAPSFLLSKIVQ